MIELYNISKTYKSKKKVKTNALSNVSLKLPDAGLVFIVGKSGSGKSTLLNIIGGLDKEDSGEIVVDGKSLKKFKSKDYDYYRNRYIGFVFQEFNLIDEYNVYDNILISLKLQRKHYDKEDCEKMLSYLGLSNLKTRKINELSGGEKQRVSIARALIKNPMVLICDEPTGSLDVINSEQIFDILKNISKSKLVIVVSHDIENAKKYGDGIIELSDGNVIYNNIIIDFVEEKKFKSYKSKLPLKDKLKFAFLNLFKHKIRLIFSIFLICASLVFFQLSRNISDIDIIHTHIKSLNDINSNTIKINKYETGFLTSYERTFDSTDYGFDKENFYKLYRVQENGIFLGLDYNTDNMVNEYGYQDAYYYHDRSLDRFIVASPDYFINKKIIGRLPLSSEEILIHSYLADIIIHTGIRKYVKQDNNTIASYIYYYPRSYDELINSEEYIAFGDSHKLKIVGIIEDDTSKYSYIKDFESYENLFDNKDGIFVAKDRDILHFMIDIVNPAYDIFVSSDFVNEENYIRNTRTTDNIIATSDKFYSRTSYLNNTNYYNGKKIIKIDKLNDNEIILNTEYLNAISNGEYNRKLDEYILDYEKEFKPKQEEKEAIQNRNDEKLKKYQKEVEQLLSDQKKGLRLDEVIEVPNFEKVPDFTYKNSSILEEEYFLNYIKDKDIIGNTISFNYITQDSRKIISTYKDVLIKGITLDKIVYVSSNIGNEAITDNVLNTEIKVTEDDYNKMYEVLKQYPINMREEFPSMYQSSSYVSDTLSTYGQVIKGYSKISLYISIVFAVFALILITNFIATSISDNKKIMGILRALGTKKSDIFTIFITQSFILYFISFILSIIIVFTIKEFGNNYLSSFYNYNLELFLYPVNNIIVAFGSFLSLVILSNIILINKILSMKPIDSINNK